MRPVDDEERQRNGWIGVFFPLVFQRFIHARTFVRLFADRDPQRRRLCGRAQEEEESARENRSFHLLVIKKKT